MAGNVTSTRSLIPTTGRLICGGLTFEQTPIELREKVAFRDSSLPQALAEMRKAMGLDEAVLVSTCNRVEYFGLARQPVHAHIGWPQFLSRFHNISTDFTPYSFQLCDQPCVEHLFEVASGLKSMVIGETEILGQIKAAYATALQAQQTGKWLNRLFQSSFSAAKDVRSHTAITRGSVSVASVAVELAERIFGDLKPRRVMVIGAGDTSEKTARTLKSKGVSAIMVANRTYDRAAALAEELGGQAIHWENWEERAVDVDIMISSTSAPHYVLTHRQMEALRRKRRRNQPIFMIDLAVPRDFEPSLHTLDDVYLYDLDDLQTIANQHLRERQSEVEQSVRILRPHVQRFLDWSARQEIQPHSPQS